MGILVSIFPTETSSDPRIETKQRLGKTLRSVLLYLRESDQRDTWSYNKNIYE